MAIKFSVIVPTRSREPYLRSCLESVFKAASLAGCDVEILVSDNASDDGTQAYLNGLDHANLVCRREDSRVSMRANFENALRAASGTHLIIIGDDDAVLPNGLAVLRRLIEKTGADAVNWQLPGYSWPDPARNEPGYLKIHPAKLSGRVRSHDADSILRSFLSGRIRGYHDGAVTYHGCVSRKLVDWAAAESDGTYFWCSSPDVFAAIHNLMMPGLKFLHVDLPITLGGASPRSNGRSGQRLSRNQETAETAEYTKFIAESERDPFNGKLPSSCPSHSLVTLDALQHAMEFHGIDPNTLDSHSWAKRIEHEIRDMAQVHRHNCAGYTKHLLGLEIGTDGEESSPAPIVVPTRKDALRKWPASAVLVDGKAMENVDTAASELDRIVGMGDDWQLMPGKAKRLWRALLIAGRVRKAAGQKG